jgi:hypothetical protein
MTLHVLLHERLEIGFFILEDLPDLRTLIVGQIQLAERQSKSLPPEGSVPVMAHRAASILCMRDSRHQSR